MLKILFVVAMLASTTAFADDTEDQEVTQRLDKLRACAAQARAETKGKGEAAEDAAYYACKDALKLPRLSDESPLFDPRQSKE